MEQQFCFERIKLKMPIKHPRGNVKWAVGIEVR